MIFMQALGHARQDLLDTIECIERDAMVNITRVLEKRVLILSCV